MSMDMLELGACCARDILREGFGIEIVDKALDPLNDKDFVTLSAILGSKLNNISEAAHAPAITQALKTLDVDWSNLTDAGRSKVVREANKQMLFPSKAIAPRLDKEFQVNAKEVFTTTKESAVAKFKLKIPSTFNAEDKRVADFVLKNQGNFITDTLGKKIDLHSEKIRQIVSDGVAQGLGRQQIGEQLFKSFKSVRDNKFYFEVVAGSFINRARTAASLSAFKQAGITRYIWDSVLDEVTTETCRFLHNKVFPVDDGLKRIEQVAQEPDQIKDLQPWVRDARDEDGNPIIVSGTGEDRVTIATVTTAAIGTADKVGEYVQKIPDSDLIDRGISMPPIHGLCRSTVLSDPSSATLAAPSQKPVVPPSALPTPPPSKGAKAQAVALSKLSKLPKTASGMGKTHPFVLHDTVPSYMDSFGPDHIDELVDKKQFKFRKPKREDVLLQSSIFDNKKVEALIKDPAALIEAQKKTILVKHNGKIFLVGDESAAIASRLLNQRRISGQMIDLDKIKPSVPTPAIVKPKTKPKKALPKVIPKPQVVPKPPELAPPDAHKNILFEKTDVARGSNAGGFYRGKDGVDRYVKFYDDPAQAASEHLANQIYRDLGLTAPNSQVFTTADGKIAYASDIFKGGRTLGTGTITKAQAKDSMDGFVGDVLTGNWDAAGMSHDNMMVLPGGKIARIDNGGTFLFRAKNGRKPPSVLNAITEWDKLLDPSVNPSYSQLASKAAFNPIDSRKLLISQIDKIDALAKANGGWGKYVHRIAPQLAGKDRAAIVTMLNERHALLKAKRLKLKAFKPPPKPTPVKAGKFPGSKFIEKPVGGVLPRKGLRFEDLPERPLPAEYQKLPSGKLPGGESTSAYRKRLQVSLSRLTAAERDAIEGFTDGTYRRIRDSEESGVLSREAELIASAIKKMDPEVRTVYRGLAGLPNSARQDFLENPIIGLGRKNAGATSSTSWKPDVAVNWINAANDSRPGKFKVLYRLNGRSCVGIENISGVGSERELIFGAKARFRVTGISRVKGTTRSIMIEAEEIGDELPKPKRPRKKKAVVKKATDEPLPDAFVDHGDGVTIRGVDIDEDFPSEVIVITKYPVNDEATLHANGRAVALKDVPTLTREELLNTVVVHPVRGMIRPWRAVWGIGF